jgi:hypothetical protein
MSNPLFTFQIARQIFSQNGHCDFVSLTIVYRTFKKYFSSYHISTWCLVFLSGIPQELFFWGGGGVGGGSANSVEDKRQREWGSGGSSPLVWGSTQFANEWNPYSDWVVIDVFSVELGIQLSSVRTLEFQYATGFSGIRWGTKETKFQSALSTYAGE